MALFSPIPYKSRLMEWWFALSTIGFGLWLMLPQFSMSTTAFDTLRAWLNEPEWATLFISTGVAHLVSLYVNGSRWWTPFARTAMLIVNTACYTVLALGFGMSHWYTTAVYTYGFMINGAAMICIYRAVKDCVHALEIRRAN